MLGLHSANETLLQSNDVSQWLGANLESALPIVFCALPSNKEMVRFNVVLEQWQ